MPIPAGFEARLKARLASAARPKWYRKPSRRQWTVGASVAAALVIGLGFWLFPFSDPAWTNAKVRAAALATYHRPSAWPKGLDESLRAQLPGRIDSRYVVAAQEIRFHGKTVTAFELRKGDQDALLLVAQSHYFVEPLDMDSFGEHGGTLFVTYVVEREEGEVCIAVARSLAPFERSVIEL